MSDDVQVLVVEDERVAARAHAVYTNRIHGFTTAGVVGSGAACLRRLAEGGIDLVLLDLHLPDSSGLDLHRRIRSEAFPVDVIVVSSARDAELVRGAVAFGAVQYLIKPFTFAAFKDKLLAYADFRYQISSQVGDLVDQAAVDRALSSLRAPSARSLPKGMSGDTLDAILLAIRDRILGADPAEVASQAAVDQAAIGPAPDGAERAPDADGLSASAVAAVIGASRITARRYLEYLVDEGVLARSLRYGTVGRPEALYRPTVSRGG